MSGALPEREIDRSLLFSLTPSVLLAFRSRLMHTCDLTTGLPGYRAMPRGADTKMAETEQRQQLCLPRPPREMFMFQFVRCGVYGTYPIAPLQ